MHYTLDYTITPLIKPNLLPWAPGLQSSNTINSPALKYTFIWFTLPNPRKVLI